MAPPQSYYSPTEAGRPSGGGYAETIISEALSHISRSSRASHASRSQSQYDHPASQAGSYAHSNAPSRSHAPSYAPSHAGTMRTHASDMHRSAMSNAHTQARSHSHYSSEMQPYDRQYMGGNGGGNGEPNRGSLYRQDMADRLHRALRDEADRLACAARVREDEAFRGMYGGAGGSSSARRVTGGAGGYGHGYDDGRSVASGYTQGTSRHGGPQYAGLQYGGYDDDDDRMIVPDDSHSVAGSREGYHGRR